MRKNESNKAGEKSKYIFKVYKKGKTKKKIRVNYKTVIITWNIIEKKDLREGYER